MSLLIGGIGGLIVVGSIIALDKYLKIDDPVGAISVHGTCGIWGVLAATLSNSDVIFLEQLIGVLAIAAFVGISSSIVWAILKYTMGIRVTEEEEEAGVDVAEVGVEAYPEFVSNPA